MFLRFANSIQQLRKKHGEWLDVNALAIQPVQCTDLSHDSQLCEINAAGESLILTWFILTILGTLSILGSSGVLFFYFYYAPNVTYEKWVRKSNPKFPSAEKVRGEILQMLKGLGVATLLPSLSLVSTQFSCGFRFSFSSCSE
jgi:hypothetical protein